MAIMIVIGRIKSRSTSLGREPERLTSAKGAPMMPPARHVAITPQPNASRVGESVLKTGG